MYFTELIIKAFGLHIKKAINFTPGLNVIVGESEKGKTTIIRALYLLIENQPRGGEKLYQSDFTDDILSVQLKDNRGNTIKRKKNKYYLNGGDPLKAFGVSVPEPIRQLFNFKEINWQRQNDVHFLLFNTGGASAKLLNDATGMGDQEIIVQEIKSLLSQSKSEIKRLRKNNDEYQQTIERLKNIVRYRLKAEAIINTSNEIDEIKIKSKKLENILIELEFINEIKTQYRKGKKYMDDLDRIETYQEEIKEYKESLGVLAKILNELKDTDVFDENTLQNYYKSLQTLESLNLEFISMNSAINSLKKCIEEIEKIRELQNETLKRIKQSQEELKQTFINLGYCPLCGREVKNGNTCCG